MISNEYGLNFIEIPFSGGDLFVDSLLESNRDLKEGDILLDNSIEYYNLAIIQNPYQRAVTIYKNGMHLRKENDLKSQKLPTYFENNLNNYDDLLLNLLPDTVKLSTDSLYQNLIAICLYISKLSDTNAMLLHKKLKGDIL